jgi:hypothetical protein
MAMTSCWWISITVSTSPLASSFMLKLRTLLLPSLRAMGWPAGSEQRSGQQAGEQGGGAIHEEQLTSIFLAQSGGSAA